MPAVTVPAQPGDTPVRVAARLGVDPAQIAALNETGMDARFFPGQPLRVPVAAVPSPLYFGAITHASIPEAVTQGRTAVMEIFTDRAVDLSVDWNGLPLSLTPVGDDPSISSPFSLRPRSSPPASIRWRWPTPPREACPCSAPGGSPSRRARTKPRPSSWTTRKTISWTRISRPANWPM
ncbi:MAG: LysM peptidoglycan-binding domain-containing protein [Caldilineaceae bacterium]